MHNIPGIVRNRFVPGNGLFLSGEFAGLLCIGRSGHKMCARPVFLCGLKPGSLPQCFRPVCSLPAELRFLTAEVAEGSGAAVDRLDQIKHLHDAVGAQVEVFAHQFGNPFLGNMRGAEGINGNGGRRGHTNGVRDLDLTAIGQSGGNDILGYIAPGVSGRAIYF